MNEAQQILKILQENWGYPSFRKGQEDIILSVLSGKDTLALMPTGGGKSITFQVPALSKPGLCMVISPLLALMKDQVQNLKRRGILASYVGSDMTRSSIIQQLDNCILGDYKFLYLSPERISSDIFLNKLPDLARKTNLLVVDEAHCISQWGNDFRPGYRLIADIRDAIPSAPVLAVTASATPTVSVDICEQLHFRKGYQLFRTPFDRKNLSFVIRQTENKEKELLHILSSVPGTAIIYCRSRDKTAYYAKFLKSNGINAAFFHAGLDTTSKNLRQQEWIEGRIRVLTATNAFGMGIDKGDVRLVVHTDFPDSLEAYYQEAGRAGRDGLRAYAVALIGTSDIGSIKKRPSQTFPTLPYIKRVYEAICMRFQLAEGFGEGQSGHFSIPEFLHDFHLDKSRLFAALQILSLSGYIKFEPYPNVPPFLLCQASKQEITPFLRSESPASDIATLIFRTYEGLFSVGSFIDVNLLAHESGRSVEEIYKLLSYLRNVGFLYIPPRTEPKITFLTIRTALDRLDIRRTAYEDRMEAFRQRIDKVIEYIESPLCRQQLLSSYFGSTDTEPCEYCDNCLKNKRKKEA